MRRVKKDITDRFFEKGSFQKQGTKALKDQLLRILKTNELDKGIRKNMVFGNWAKIVGKKVAEHSKPTRIDGDILFIKVEDPSWKFELQMMYQTLNQKVQKATKYEITKIRII